MLHEKTHRHGRSRVEIDGGGGNDALDGMGGDDEIGRR